METLSLEESRRRLFVVLCLALSCPVMFGFAIIDYFEADILELTVDILLFSFFLLGAIGIKKHKADLPIYRVSLGLLGAGSLYSVFIGAGNGTSIYWLFPFPIVFMFFLGKNEGTAFTALFILLLSLILIDPFSFSGYAYKNDVSVRYILSFFFLSLIIYGLEASIERYSRMLMEEQNQLLDEKLRLEKALADNKTLSGLIPICSRCKKIRNDEGYWQQVEIYVRDHSKADFSHGICPDCVDKFYPGLIRPI